MSKKSGASFFRQSNAIEVPPLYEFAPVAENVHGYMMVLYPFLNLFIDQEARDGINRRIVQIPDDGSLIAGLMAAIHLDLVTPHKGHRAQLTATGIELMAAGLEGVPS